MIQYKREILSIYVNPKVDETLKNVVTRVTWRWAAKEFEYFADIYRDTVFTTIDPNNFVEYQNLTDEVVFSWIDAVENIVTIKDSLDQALNNVKTSELVEKPIPWNKSIIYTGTEEYFIVIDDDLEKTIGPTRWQSDIMSALIKTLGVQDFIFPNDTAMYRFELLPIDQPYVASDRVKVYLVEYDETPTIDDNFQYFDGTLIWDVTTGKAVCSRVVLDHPINDVKAHLNSKVYTTSIDKQNTAFDAIFKGANVKLSCEIQSRTTLLQRWLSMDNDDLILYKSNDPIWFELTKSDAYVLLSIMNTHIETTLAWEKTLMDTINSCATINDLKAIVI